MAHATLTSKGQTTIPKAIRDKLRLKPGDRLDFQMQVDGTVRMTPATLRAASLYGLLRSAKRGVTVDRMNRDMEDAASEAAMRHGGKRRR